MTFLSRWKTVTRDADPRTRATGSPWHVERLEERVLLSKVFDASAARDDHGGLDVETASLLRQQVVQVKVSDLVADGLGGVIQGLPVQDGQVQAIRTGDVLQIGNAFFQYASGPGYPLVPVNGPAVAGDVGVPRGPMPVLLPMTEPAPAMVSTENAVPSPAQAPAPTPALAPVETSMMPVLLPTTETAPAMVPTESAVPSPAQAPAPTPAAAPVENSISTSTSSQADSMAAAAAPAVAAVAMPGAASAAASVPVPLVLVPVITGSPVQSSAAEPAGSTTSPAPAVAPAPASVTSAAGQAAATSNDAGTEHAAAPATSASQTGPVAVVIAANAASPDTATDEASPATTSAPATNNPSLPAGRGLPPAPVAFGDRSSPGQDGSDEPQAGSTPAADSAGPIAGPIVAGAEGAAVEVSEGNGRQVRPRNSGGDVDGAETIADEAVAALDAENEDGEASESTELLDSLAPFIAGSVACLAWGNYLHATGPAEHRDDEESEDASDAQPS